MVTQQRSTRQRLIQAALQLFAAQGVTETATKQIAELAGVNEVTLFRHFGSKHGLLLAVIEDADVFTQLGEILGQQARQMSSVSQAIKDYARNRLQALDQIPEFVRSLVGESGQYPVENRQAIGQALMQANHHTAEYLATVINHEQMQLHVPVEKLASLLNGLLLGYAVLEFTSEFHQLWQDQEEFVEYLAELFLHGAVSYPDAKPDTAQLTEEVTNGILATEAVAVDVADLPAGQVREILQRARKAGHQDYALVYVLFGAGLSPAEVAGLQRSHSISDSKQHLLQVTQGAFRQLPLNQWIMGHRYGSHPRNPLTQWLKSRKDEQSALFLNEAGEPISEADIHQIWEQLTSGLVAPNGGAIAIEQTYQTWCVEMLMKGMNLEDLSILTGRALAELQPYARRAREKAALEQAIRLDHKPGSHSTLKTNSGDSIIHPRDRG